MLLLMYWGWICWLRMIVDAALLCHAARVSARVRQTALGSNTVARMMALSFSMRALFREQEKL